MCSLRQAFRTKDTHSTQTYKATATVNAMNSGMLGLQGEQYLLYRLCYVLLLSALLKVCGTALLCGRCVTLCDGRNMSQ